MSTNRISATDRPITGEQMQDSTMCCTTANDQLTSLSLELLVIIGLNVVGAMAPDQFKFWGLFALGLSSCKIYKDVRDATMMKLTEICIIGDEANRGIRAMFEQIWKRERGKITAIRKMSLYNVTDGDEPYMYINVTDDDLQHLEILQFKHLTELHVGEPSRWSLLVGILDGDGLSHQHLVITDSMLPHLRQLKNLTKLSLFDQRITDEGLQYLGEITTLVKLNFGRCDEITDDGLQHLAQLKNLTKLNVEGCHKITDNGIQIVGDLKNMTKLDLDGCSKITDHGLQHLPQLKKLTHLSLEECNKITDSGLQHLGQMKKLTKLDLRRCKITDNGLQHFAQLKKLAKLNLLGCDKISDKGLYHLAQLKDMTWLTLGGCNHITDNGMQIVGGLKNMTKLDLRSCKITDSGLQHLAQLSNLTKLDLQRCEITDNGLQHLAQLNNLTKLDLRRCEITDNGLQHLAQLEQSGCKLLAGGTRGASWFADYDQGDVMLEDEMDHLW